MNAVPKNILAILEALPGFPAASERAAAAEVEARQRHLLEIERLNREAEKRWAPQEEAMSKATEKVREAERVLKSVGEEHARVAHKVSQDRAAYEHARRRCEIALMVDTAELVDGFAREICAALDETRANATTSAAAEPRLRAMLQTLRSDLPRLRLYPDVAALADEFDRIKTSWPPLSAEASVSLTRARPARDGMGFRPRGSIT